LVTMSDQGGSAKNVEQTMTTTSGFALNQLSDLVLNNWKQTWIHTQSVQVTIS